MTDTDTAPAAASALPDALALGTASLRVSDLSRSIAFYEDIVGLTALDRSRAEAALGGEGGAPVLRLVETPGVRLRPRNAAGLFHVAILLPERRDLAAALARGLRAEALTGASDHLVSEALYLDDPDGNGVEIYRDRPRAEWPFENGRLMMATKPIDGAGLSVIPGVDADDRAPAKTALGHVHLQVGDLDRTRAFWIEAVGFALTTTYPGALFMSAGGYHHHVATNVWSSRGAGAPPADAAGLIEFEVKLPDADAVAGVGEQLRRHGVAVEQRDGAISAADPWGSRAVFLAAD